MGRVLFYHLTRSPLEETLTTLLGKALEAGLRVDLRGRDGARLDWLDERLWLGPEDGFLPHGRAGGPHDARQPVLLTTAAAVRDGTTCLMTIDGAEVAPPETSALKRVCILFDGQDPAAVEVAREQWRSLTAAGVQAEYWSQQDGPWTCRMRSGT